MKIEFIKYFLILVFSFQVLTIVSASEKEKTENPEFCENFISIAGTSNINQFYFKNNNLNFEHIELQSFIDKKLSLQSIQIPVKEFDCKNKIMYNDFQKLMKASEYPNVEIQVVQKEVIQTEATKALTDFNIHISLAGVSKNYTLPCEIIPCGNSEYLLKGEKQVKLTDFQIDPPAKVFGAIKVEDTVFITFAFRFVVKET